MSRSIPNLDQVDNDLSLSPIEVVASVVIIDNGTDWFWYPSIMDPLTADRFAFAITQGTNIEAFRLDIPLILPSAVDLQSEIETVDQLTSDPIRTILRAG